MARKRMIDPTIWADEDFNNLSSDAKILFIGMISNADDEGRLPGNSLYLSANIFPYAGMTKEKAEKLRGEVLARMSSVVLYEVDGKEYLQLKKWDDYQSINRPTPSKYPPLTEGSRRTHGGLTPNRIEKNRIEKNIYSSIKSLNEETIEEVSQLYKVSRENVADIAEELRLYCSSNGRKYSNYKSALQNWVRRAVKDQKISIIKEEDDYVRRLNEVSKR